MIKWPNHEANHTTVCLQASAAVCQAACFSPEIIQLFSTKIWEIQFLNSYRSNTTHAIHESLTELPLISKSEYSPHLRNVEVQYRVHKKQPVVHINSLNTLSSYLFRIHFNITLQMVSFPFKFSNQNIVSIFRHAHACWMLQPPHSPPSDHPFHKP